MHRAYIFRRGIAAEPQNRNQAHLVSVDEYVEEYGDRIRCPYEPCFQALQAIRPIRAQHHWRHPPAREDEYCPFRVDGSDSGSSAWRPDWAALDDVLLRVRDRLAETGTACRIGRAGGNRAGLIGNWGAILPINPSNARDLAKSFEVEGRTVIPIVALQDLKRLNEIKLAPFLREIIERQPVPVIRPEMEGPAGRWSLLIDSDQLSPEQIEDMIVGAIPIPINARGLFGEPAHDASFPWPPPGLVPIWVWTDHKDGLDAVKDGLENSEPLGTKVLRLLAKRLLVDGGSVHRALFAQAREEACDFFLVAEKTFPRAEQIVQPAELAEIDRDIKLASVLGASHLVQGCFRDLKTQGRILEKRRSEQAAANTQFEQELEGHKQESDERHNRALQLEKELSRHQKAINEMTNEIKDYKTRSDERHNQALQLEKELSQHQKAINEMTNEIKDYKTREESASRRLQQVRKWMGWALVFAALVILALASAWLLSG